MKTDEEKEAARLRRNEAQRLRRASPEAKAKEAAASRASKARKNNDPGAFVSRADHTLLQSSLLGDSHMMAKIPDAEHYLEASTEPPKAPETSAPSVDGLGLNTASDSPRSFRSPNRAESARRPVRVLSTSRFNRKLWQGLRADAAAMTPAERERVGMPAELPPEAEPDRTPGRHGPWLTPKQRRLLTSDLRRARLE